MTTSTSFAQMANNQSISLLSALRANTPPTKGQTPSRKFLTLSIFFLLSFFCTTNAWGADVTLSSSTITSGKKLAYTTEWTHTSGDVVWSGYCYTDANNRPWIQLKKDQGVYIKITTPNNTKITNLKTTITSATNSSNGITDIAKHTDFSGRIALLTADATGSTSMTGVAFTTSVSNDIATLSPSGENNVLYLKVSAGARIWSMTVTYESLAPTTYTVTLNPNYPEGKTGVFKDKSNKTINGNLELSYPSGTASMQITSLYNSLTLDGYEFGGWYSAKGVNPGEVSGSKFTTTGTITGNKTYYAKWTQKVYTVTATSNNNNYGTVSVSGTTITASPKTGYTYANPAYTVTSGTAIVTQNGNTFTVSPSTNCTVCINFEELPKYTVTLDAGPGTCAASVAETSAGAGVTLPTPTLDCGEWEFAGWKTTSAVTTETTTKPTLIPAGTYKPTTNITLYAVYQRTEEIEGGGSTTTVVDNLTHSINGKENTNTGYVEFSGKSYTSNAVYAGNTTNGNNSNIKGVIQIRSDKSTAGIVTTTSGGKAKKVTVVWNSSTADGRTLDIYGKNSAYTAATDLYSTSKSTQGTKLGSIAKGSTTLTITGDYEYIGLRSNSGAMYLTSIAITWESTTSGGTTTTTYYHSTPDCGPSTYTVTFDANGHGTAPDAKTVASGSKVTAPTPAPTATGYTFGGWYKEAGCTNQFDFSTSITKDITLYAKWTANTYTVTLDNQGATTAGAASVTATYNAAMPSIASNLPKKTGYTFGGYFTGQNGEGTQYYNQSGGAYNNKKWDQATNATLYAKWTANKYTVKFNGNDNTGGSMNDQSFTYGQAQNLTANAFTRTGYTFKGWNTNKSGSGTSYTDGQEVINLTSTSGGQITLYAQWTELPKYTVSFSTGTGNPTQVAIQETIGGAGIILPTGPTPTCTDWDFAGWAETIVTETTTAPTLLSKGNNYKPTEDCMLYAVYSKTETDEGGGTTPTEATLSFASTAQRTSFSSTQQVWEQNGIILTNNKSASTSSVADYSSPARFYASSEIIIEAPGNITQIVATCPETKYTTALVNSVGTGASSNNNVVTIIPAAPSTTYTIAKLTAQVQMLSLAVTYLTESGSTTTTTYNSNPECGPQKLATPNVTVSNISTSSAKLSWDAVPNTAQGYSLVIKSGETIVKNISSGATYYTADNLLPGTTYTYTVVARGNGTNYSDSDPATGTFTTACIIQWFANGELMATTDGMISDEITMPGEQPASCDDAKEFVGWTATPIDGSTDTKPTDLFTESPDNITGNATYHAVFATKSTGSGETTIIKTETFSNQTSHQSESNWQQALTWGATESNIGVEWSTYYGKILANDDYVEIRTYSDKKMGYIWSSQKIKGIKSIQFNGWHVTESDAADMVVSYSKNNDNDWIEIGTHTAGSSSDSRSGIYTIPEAGPEEEYYISIDLYNATCPSSSNKKYRIDNISLTILEGSGSSTTYSGYVTTCCTQPKTLLTITADQTELVKSGVVTLTATGGNGTNITWTTTGGELSNQSNTGATLTISDVDATQNITVTATQAENNNDDEVVYCAQEASIDITVKAQWTITFWTNDNGNKESNSMTVTDGDSYTMPDISDEYICTTGHSFVGWVDNENDTELDATPNSTQTATANQTWYAAWSSSASTKIVDVYQLVTNVTNLAAGDKVWITNTTPTVAMGVQNENNRGQVTVTKHPTESDKIYSTGSPATLTIGKDGTNYTFHDGTGYLYAASSSKNYLRRQATNNANGKWSISIASGKATITAQGDNTHNKLKYNSGSSIFSCYESGQGDVRIYKNVGTAEIEVSGASITTNNTSCHRGAVISAENGKWITSSKGQKVRIAINVTARGFNSDATLSATSANEHFSVVSITNTTITQNSAFETQMMIEYQPAEANTNENAEITLVAKKGEEVVATRTIDVNGRSLPDEFVIVAQYGDKWLALPANMQSGADQYNGIEVTPNNTLTQIPAAPSTTIYSLRGVADNRYEVAGTCVRLVGNGNKCLWGNAATTNTTIQNWTTLASTNGSNYEWLLTTSDGELYTIANPAHRDYNEGRILSNSGSKYGLYKGTTKFYILPVGCSSQPGNIQVTARRVDATFSWEGNASSMKIDVYTNKAMTEGNISNTATASPYYMTGLSESTQYWFTMTPNGTDYACAYTGSFKTTGPTIDVVEWQENAAVIFVDKDDELNPLVIIDGEVEHGVGGTKATDIFFSKYFEAQSEAKLLAIYNGTANAISLSDITILQRGTKHSSSYTPLSLAPYGKTAGWIQPGEELILYNEDQSANSSDIMKCAESDPTFSNWVKVDNNNLAFSGKGTIRLFRGNTCIDIIGAMGRAEDIHKKEVTPLEGTELPGFGDKEGFTTSTGDNYSTDVEEKDYMLSTNRCLLVRKPSVTSGAIAVTNNIGDFKTLGNDYDGIKNEWAGLQVPNGPNDDKFQYTCEGFQEVGSFDYNNYYKEYNNIDDDTYLETYTHDDDTKEYIIPIKDLAKYSCLNIRFQLKQDDQVLTEEPVQVPIIVSDEKATNDAIFNAIVKTDASEPVYDQSIERCKTCNVVVLSDATLTKAANNATNDVAEVANLKVYPGGQVIVPASTEYTVNSLAFRRQEDEVSMANIQGTLNVKHANGVYLDVRIDPSNWHYMTLPYDCRVGDITFVDGTPAVVNTDYLLGWYDGAYRAEHKTGGWTYITDNDYILKKGLGYIVALPGDGKVRREIRFPMANSVIAEDLTSKTVSGLYAYGGDKTDAELRPNHKGWNMIGSPYLYTYTTDIVKEPLQMGTLEHSPVSPWDGTWVRTGDARYIVEPIDNGWSGYEQKTIDYLKPFTSYFIQVGGKLENGEYTTITPETEQQIVFAANSVARNASAPRKVAEAEVMDNHPVWYGVEMIAPNNEKDNTTLLISNEFTDGYDMMDDLVKMRGDYYQYYNFPVLASRNNEGEMAFNALPDSSAAKIGVPLSYYAATAGTYTIATDGRFDLEEVKAAMLYDATTAQYTNLLTENYSFTTNKGNNTNRFTLFVTVERKKVPNITTGMDNLLANGQLSLIAVERTLVLSGLTENADIYVYDMSGKMVTGTHSAGKNGIWRTTVPATGVYFVRVNSANSQQTLRTIVK